MEQTILHWPEVGVGDEGVGMTVAAEAGGVGAMATAAAAGTAILVGSPIVAKIADAAGVDGFIYRLWTGHDYVGQATTVTGEKYASINNVSWADWTPPAGAAWYYRSDQGSAYSDNCPCSNDYSNQAWDTRARAEWAAVGGGAVTSGLTDTAALAERTSFDDAGHNGDCPWPQLGHCYIITRTNVQQAEALTVGAATSADYNSYPHFTGSLASSCDDTCLQNALNGIHAGDTSKQTTADAAAVTKLRGDAGLDTASMPDCSGLTVSACTSAYTSAGFTGTVTSTVADFAGADVAIPADDVIEQSIEAGVATPLTDDLEVTVNPAEEEMPFTIPRPYNYETYDDYIARLSALGYIGTITETDLSDETADTSVGPNGVPRLAVKLGTDTVTTTLNRSAWPTLAPKAKRSASIQIWKNPADIPVPPPDPTDTVPNPDPGAGGGGAGNCGPTIPSVDMTPITGVDFGNKFPFGIFGFVASALSPLVASPSPPVFDVPIALMGNSYSLHVDFSPADPYMSTIRLLMEIGIGIAAIWLLAGSLLGFKAGSAGGGLDMDTSLGDD